jgi:hypothetical protein
MLQPKRLKVRELINNSMNKKLGTINPNVTTETVKDNIKTKIIKDNKILSSKDKLILAEKENQTALKKSNDIAIKDKVYNSMQEVYKHPLGNPGLLTPEGLAINSIKSAVRLPSSINKGNKSEIVEDVLGLVPEIGSLAKQAKNIYKINPLAEKLNSVNKSYRVAGLDSFEDFKSTGVLRSKAPSTSSNIFDRVASRPTSFPSFQKGRADLSYLPKNGGVVYETSLPTYKRGDINPVTNLPIKGRHYAHRVLDKTGATVESIPSKDIKVFKSKPNWLTGYKEIKQ